MLFNSIDFAIFLPIVFLLYWFVTNKNLRLQNFLIVLVSYVFYGWWDYRFLSLILFSTVVDYLVGTVLSTTQDAAKRKALLWISILVNLGLLSFFKYYNFFLENFIEAFSFLGMEISANNLHIILPVGISFYTFQTMSYTIDVYNQRLKPTNDFIAFAAFVSFFPQLVAGPIERATNLLPQILKARKFNYTQAIQGVRLILWGLFRKVVIADALAPSVDEIFSNYSNYPSHILIMGAVFFGVQIYGDFSGYSLIARGVAKLLGFELMTNFNFPYFSRSIGEFWRKWHISLSTWFRDYVYIPLGGSKVSQWKGIRNVFIIFLVSGFWHGANWTFIVWGAIHAILFIPSFIVGTNRLHTEDLPQTRFILPRIGDAWGMLRTFIFVTLAWIFFRAENISEAYDYIQGIARLDFSQMNFLNPYDNQPLFKEFLWVGLFFIVEYLFVTRWLSIYSKGRVAQVLIDGALMGIIIINSPVSSDLSFIYFQF